VKNLKKVLACVDFSEYSREIVQYSLALVGESVEEVVILNVIDSRDVDAVKSAVSHYNKSDTVENYIKKEKGYRYRRIRQMTREFEEHYRVKMRILVRVGVPFDAILKAINTENIDLVVIASKGRSNLIGTLHGSNAEKVFRHSPVPVLSVRKRKQNDGEVQAEVETKNIITRIVVGIDFSRYSPFILKYAAGIAARTGAEIIVVNVINKRQIEYVKTLIEDRCADMVSVELGGLVTEVVPKQVAVGTIVRNGVPFEEILQVVNDKNAELLVMNSKGRSNFQDYMFGTTSEKMYRHSPVSVLTLNMRKAS
jgi:nucleotide-binding universal stress UspA family protein